MKKLRDLIKEIVRKWVKGTSISDILLYGCSPETMILISVLNEMGMLVDAVMDGDTAKHGKKWYGVRIVSPDYAKDKNTEHSGVIVWSIHKKSMLEYLEQNEIFNVLCIDIDRESEEYLNAKIDYLNEARNIYDRIKSVRGDCIFLITPGPSGDVYVALSYLDKWKKQKNINKNICLVGTSDNSKEIASLYGVDEFEKINESERLSLLFLHTVCEDELDILLVSPWELNTKNSFFPRYNSEFLFSDKYRYEVFDLTDGTEGCYPQMNRFEECDRNGVVIAPYAYSSPAPRLHINFWEKLVDTIKKEEENVFTVGYGEKEPAIKGTNLIRFSYKDIGQVLGKCKAFISVRSGLCDIAHNVSCNMVVLYTNTVMQKSTYFYGMKNNYKDYTGIEINCDNMTEKQLIKEIMMGIRR